MQLTEDVRVVLDIVRRVLSRRTEWVTQEQDLMTEIESEVQRVPDSRKA
jgi:hypothetical protein